ncbi:MAG TPA: hypothetical protein VH679_08225 [Vicinamibacterales bacterium]|jgi:hypothetical protein
MSRLGLIAASVLFLAGSDPVPAAGQDPARVEFRILATSKTSTMEKEMNEAAEAGFRYSAVMGGETAIGGSEVVTVFSRTPGAKPRYQYRLLATNRTSTMQRELQQAADAGFEYRGQTVFDTLMGGKEVVCILERDRENSAPNVYQYRLLATSKTSTMQKELQVAGDQGYEVVGMTVAKTAIGGNELVTITRRKTR